MKRISLSLVFLVIAGYMFAANSVQTLQNGMKVSPQNGAAKTIEIGVVNRRISLSLVFLVIAGYMFAANSVQTLQNGMKVSPQNGAAKTIEIGVVNSRIIRVQASSENVIPNVFSLCVLPGLTTTPFKVTSDAQFAQLSTDELTVIVSLLTGEILFTDKSGKILLSEAKNGRSFKPFAVENDKGYTMQQLSLIHIS